MRPRGIRPTITLICCIVVALSSIGAERVWAQGMVVPRVVCPPPPCGPNGRCAAPPCGWQAGSPVVRTFSTVRAELGDRVLRFEVTEKFVNRGPRLEEADYLFPLPSGAAFQDLKLSINGELVAGEALNAQEARGVYEEIVRRQRDPALVEWMGAGLLRARIFPITPGEEKTVVVRFQTVAPREGDALRIDYAGAGAPAGRTGWRPGISGGPMPPPPPRRGENDEESRGAGDSSFVLIYPANAGYGAPYSPTHVLRMGQLGDRRTARIEGSARDVTILLPVPHSTSAAVTVLPYAPGDGPGFALITVAPPSVRTAATSRDVTFVLDVSGSMSGQKMEQARAAGRQLLETLGARDRFRMIDFSTDVRSFRDDFVFATGAHVREAEHYLDQLEAEGSTNIAGALAAALSPPRGGDDGAPAEPRDGEGDTREPHVHQRGTGDRLPLVLFITDGEPTIGERSPDALVAQALSHLGHARLFTFGLGADVNTSLLEQLALQGHGTAQFVRPEESVERAVSLVAHRLTDPVITDVELHVDGVRLTHMLPALPLDLFSGQDLVLLARYQGSGTAQLHFTGQTSQGPVSWTTGVVFPDRERANPFVARLWATQRVGYLEAERHKSGGSPELDEELKTLGERYGIPTEFTSYLVREPALVLNAGVPGGTGGIGLRRDTRPMPAASPGSQLGAVVVTGAAAAADAKKAAAQREATSLSAADRANYVATEHDMVTDSLAASRPAMASGGAGGSGAVNVRHAGERTFVLRDSVWTDTRYENKDRVIRVRAFSDAYFAVLRVVPALREAFALSDRVLVAGRGIAVEVSPAGMGQLTDADLAVVRAGW